MTAEASLADRFRDHAFRMQPGLYRGLLYEMADSWEAGGVVRTICRGWEDAPAGAVVALRLLAGLQRLVLTRQAPELAFYYPNLGGFGDPIGAWPAFEAALTEHADYLHDALDIAPQTNEPGRAAALLVGIFDVVRRSGLTNLRLLELGASAGLNLLVDRFRIDGKPPVPWSSGPADSPLRLVDAVDGDVRPVDYTIVQRRGCDLSPVDPTSQDGRLRLTSFVWPHHLERHERLKAALKVAAAHRPRVDQCAAADWLADQLGAPAVDGVLTVVWHSVTTQYWPDAERDRVDQLLAEASDRIPIARVSMEYPSQFAEAELTVALRTPDQPAEEFAPRTLAEVADHGLPVTMAPE